LIGSTPLRVFESAPAPGRIVKYIDSVVRHAPTDIEFSFFSWRTALFGRYDLFHVHWPEFLVRGRSRFRGLVRRVLFRVFLLRLAAGRVPVVRTVHNMEPHRPVTTAEGKLLARLDKMVQRYVVMSDCGRESLRAPSVVIPHGDFVEVFEQEKRSSRVGGRVLLFGRIEPYKGVIDLIRAAHDTDPSAVEVRIVGSATSAMADEVREEIAVARKAGARITTDLRRVTDEEMVAELTKADIVALPYRDAGSGNSGVAMVALSLNRPVLVYRSCIMERLAEEVGDDWVQMMDGVISADQIESALAIAGGLSEAARPNLVNRDWRSVASAYADVFRAVIGGR
jgi:beta-1,4-mannosyltransferase